MHYTNDFITSLIPKVKIPAGNEYVAHSAKMFATLLNKNREYYKMFGVYWWAVKDALRQYVHNNSWYCKNADDPLMKERAWHGDSFRTVLAAAFYQSEQIEQRSEHVWYDTDGNEHLYTLFDNDAGI